MEQLKLLQKEFIGRGEVKGFHFKQVYKHDKFYIYKVTDENRSYYELIKRTVNKDYITRSPVESYPTSKSFGKKAWTQPTIAMIIESIKKHFDIDLQAIDIEI